MDVYQAGAGTSHNMNCNEVLANRANELLGLSAGSLSAGASERSRQHGAEHQRRDPHRDAAGNSATLSRTLAALDRLATSLLAKGEEFDHIIKSGRTHLQDATPIRLGQEFTAYGRTVRRHRDKLEAAADWLRELNIGGTAVGTGLNAEPEYAELMVKQLAGLPGCSFGLDATDSADAVDGRLCHFQRGPSGVRARPEQDRQ